MIHHKRLLTRVTRVTRASALLLLLGGISPGPDPAIAKSKAAVKAERVEDLQIVDCLLPGQVRRLGRTSNYVTPRRPTRTSAIDCRIRGGDYVDFDRASYATALEVWLPEAKAGDPEAQTHVGEIFEKGLADTPDFQAAASWYRKAAEQGYSRAQINLGQLYESGRGVEQDRALALDWYRRAAGLDLEIQLDATEELREARKELDELHQRLGTAESGLTRARIDLERAKKETEGLREELEAARRQAASEARIRELSDQLAGGEDKVARSRASLDDLQGKVEDYARRLADLEETATPAEATAPGPKIEIMQPDVLATRGPALASIPANAISVALLGHVSAEAGLASLQANGAPVTVADDGVFTTEVAISGRTEVLLVALDRLERESRVSLTLVPSASGKSTPPAAIETRARMRAASPKARRFALVIHAADYLYLTPLKTTENDARAVAEILDEHYGFRVTRLANPTYFQLLKAFAELQAELKEEDSLLVYYAGHGSMEKAGNRGFWLPIDAREQDKSNWIPNEVVSDYLSTMQARHVLVVSDSCYAGTLTESGLPFFDPGGDEPQTEGKSRTVLTSGGLQPVLDEGGGEHSIFARYFLNVLELNRDALPGTSLHQEVAARVAYTTAKKGLQQFPQYAPIRFAGHEGGDFLLVRR